MLKRLPAATRLLFVSGEKDEFLDRTTGGTAWRKGAVPRGVAALRSVAADLPCAANITVVGIERTGHACFKAGRKKVEPAKELVLRALEPFAEAFHGLAMARIDTRLTPGDDSSDEEEKYDTDMKRRKRERDRQEEGPLTLPQSVKPADPYSGWKAS